MAAGIVNGTFEEVFLAYFANLKGQNVETYVYALETAVCFEWHDHGSVSPLKGGN